MVERLRGTQKVWGSNPHISTLKNFMKNKKIQVAILFGGKSAEHEVSIQSARNIARAIDRKKYQPSLIWIDKAGKWLEIKDLKKFISAQDYTIDKLATVIENPIFVLQNKVDVVFPILHGPFGEDGTVQGFLKTFNIPFVGAGVLGSAVGMDKDTMKRLFREAGIPTAKFLTMGEFNIPTYAEAVKNLGLPLFIKPANLGSSVGVSKVSNQKAFKKALIGAFKYDTKVIIEEFIKGREIECSVLGNDNPKASVPGEIIPSHDFYSYEAKYLDENGAALKVPADLPKSIIKKIQELAVKTFKTLSCEGMGRVDFFLRNNKEIFVNEINTLPGFTSISMYPKLWEASGISYTKLIDKLIQLAIDRFKKEQELKTSYN